MLCLLPITVCAVVSFLDASVIMTCCVYVQSSVSLIQNARNSDGMVDDCSRCTRWTTHGNVRVFVKVEYVNAPGQRPDMCGCF